MRQSRQRVFTATAWLIGATPPRVAVSATLIENITRQLQVQVAPSRAASVIPLAMEYRLHIQVVQTRATPAKRAPGTADIHSLTIQRQ